MNELKKADIIIIGGGIMGLMTAYYASVMGKKVTVLEKTFVGNRNTASYGLTRSIRSDYLDPTYAKLARKPSRYGKILKRNKRRTLLLIADV